MINSTPLRSLLLLAVAGSGLLLFTGCDDRDEVVYRDRPAYYGGDGADFYYVGGRPYSRSYGELVFRDGGYYYNHGGNFVVYDRGEARGGYRGGYAGNDRYRGGDRRVDTERNYRSSTVNNYYGANAGARSRNAPAYGQTAARGNYQQGSRSPYVRTQARGTQPVQGQHPNQVERKKKVEDNH